MLRLENIAVPVAGEKRSVCVEACEVIYNKKSNIFDFFICHINIHAGMLILHHFYDKIRKSLASVLLHL